jgi:CRP-like cAMP-binding protein
MKATDIFEGPNQLRMISRRFMSEFTDSAETIEYKRGQQWLAQGQHSREILLIKNGAMASSRQYVRTSCVSMLWRDGNIVLQPDSFFLLQPSLQDIWFLCDTTVYSISQRSVNALSAKYDDMQFILCFYLADALKKATNHSFMLTYHTPVEKLAYARSQFKEAFNLLTREQQASFLGITRRTLSELF